MTRILVFNTVTFLLIVCALVSTIVVVQQNRHLARDGKQAHDGLCVLKDDYRHRVRDSKEFLILHPNGIDGISRSAILNSIANLQATIDALNIIHCSSDDLRTQ